MSIALWLLFALLLLALLYWLIVVGEGTYLGRSVVRLIYQLGAGVYDQARANVIASDEALLLLPRQAEAREQLCGIRMRRLGKAAHDIGKDHHRHVVGRDESDLLLGGGELRVRRGDERAADQHSRRAADAQVTGCATC